MDRHPAGGRGLAGLAEGWRDWLSAWEDFRVEAEEYREPTGIATACSPTSASHRRSSMTPAEKVALAQRSYAAFSAGPDVEALISLYHPECEWRMGPMGAAFGTESFRGHDGLRAWASAIGEGFDGFAGVIDEAKITREGAVLLRGYATARSRDTHMELSMPAFWQEIAFRDGLIVSIVQYDEPPPGWDDATPITCT
jgi:ketosteroid isomerase-like protein